MVVALPKRTSVSLADIEPHVQAPKGDAKVILFRCGEGRRLARAHNPVLRGSTPRPATKMKVAFACPRCRRVFTEKRIIKHMTAPSCGADPRRVLAARLIAWKTSK